MPEYQVPDRTDLIGKTVRIKLHRWAAKGPTKGIFNGQGERGLSITPPGGGRYTYRHAEVKSVALVRRWLWRSTPESS